MNLNTNILAKVRKANKWIFQHMIPIRRTKMEFKKPMKTRKTRTPRNALCVHLSPNKPKNKNKGVKRSIIETLLTTVSWHHHPLLQRKHKTSTKIPSSLSLCPSLSLFFPPLVSIGTTSIFGTFGTNYIIFKNLEIFKFLFFSPKKKVKKIKESFGIFRNILLFRNENLQKQIYLFIYLFIYYSGHMCQSCPCTMV